MLPWDNPRHVKGSHRSAPWLSCIQVRWELCCDLGQHQWCEVGHAAAHPGAGQVAGIWHWRWLAMEAAASALPGSEAGRPSLEVDLATERLGGWEVRSKDWLQGPKQ